MQEQDPKLQMIDALLASPHRRLVEFGRRHVEARDSDLDFYGRLGAWYHSRGVIRDQRLLFTAHMGTSRYPAHREAAHVLLQSLRTYEVARLLRYLKEHVRSVPRPVKRAVEHWLRRRERNEAWFDEVALRDRRNLKTLYASLHIRPSPRAGQILFDRCCPEDSRLAVVKRLARIQSPREKARLIVQHRIFASTALGAVGALEPPVLAAVIDVMTPQQLANSLAALKRRGALNHPELRQLIAAKLEAGRSDGRFQDARVLRAMDAVGDDALGRQLSSIATDRLRARGQIRKSTAMLVDKSGSMEMALTVGCHLASLCSTVMAAPLWIYAFDSVGRRIETPEDSSLAGWQQAFKTLSASGVTSIGAPLVNMARDGVEPEQIVIITDGEENTAPRFHHTYSELCEAVGRSVPVIVVFVAERDTGATSLEKDLRRQGVDYTAYRFAGDLYSLPNVIPFLSQPSRADVCAQVLDTPLPTYADLERLPPGFDPATCQLI